jgi:hypothetical protein
LNWIDPSGLITVGFYSTSDPPMTDNFLEAADDHDRYYKMDESSDVIDALKELEAELEKEGNGEMITDVYFYDHCVQAWQYTESQGWFFEELAGLRFGTEVTGEDLKKFSSELKEATSEDTILHFRQCYVAMNIDEDESTSLLEDLAEWTNRTVTGCTGRVDYVTSSPSGEPIQGADYTLNGQYWMAWTAEQGTGTHLLWSVYWPSQERPKQPY